MPVYQVERVIPGAGMAAVEAIRGRAAAACLTPSARGVRYLRSIYTPGDSRCRCLFEAASAEDVRRLNDAAQIPYQRIVVAVDFHGATSADARTHEGDER